MRDIAELTVILREPIAIPTGFKLATEKFCQNWSFALRFNAQQLEAEVCAQGWGFIRIADVLQTSGIGKSSQQAIASALKLVVCHASKHSNVAEVKYIELTHYPWFCLARVRVSQYHILHSSISTVPNDLLASASAAEQKRLPLHASDLYQDFGSVMPQLKQMLVLPVERHGPNRAMQSLSSPVR
jgi:hypothetical protein